jgi:hypothetical protein
MYGGALAYGQMCWRTGLVTGGWQDQGLVEINPVKNCRLPLKNIGVGGGGEFLGDGRARARTCTHTPLTRGRARLNRSCLGHSSMTPTARLKSARLVQESMTSARSRDPRARL